MMIDPDIQLAASQLAHSQQVIVLSGSLTSPFLSSSDPQNYSSRAAFEHHPDRVWEWHERKRKCVAYHTPNVLHHAVAALEDLVPHVTVLTESISGIHQKAGSSDVIDLFGNINRYRCSNNCKGDPTLLHTAREFPGTYPNCPHCGAYVRHDVVWFDEPVLPALVQRIQTLQAQADTVLILGNIGMTYPIGTLPFYAKRYNNAYLINVCAQDTALAGLVDLRITDKAALSEIVHVMRKGVAV